MNQFDKSNKDVPNDRGGEGGSVSITLEEIHASNLIHLRSYRPRRNSDMQVSAVLVLVEHFTCRGNQGGS